jgi:hypothetical protein
LDLIEKNIEDEFQQGSKHELIDREKLNKDNTKSKGNLTRPKKDERGMKA